MWSRAIWIEDLKSPLDSNGNLKQLGKTTLSKNDKIKNQAPSKTETVKEPRIDITHSGIIACNEVSR